MSDGSKEKLWNTFGPEQIDLDVRKKVTQKFIKDTLTNLIKHGADIIRLDAFAYAVKKLDTNDFFVEPEIWELLKQVQNDTAVMSTHIQVFSALLHKYSISGLTRLLFLYPIKI